MGILVVIYSTINISGIIDAFSQSNLFWLIISLCMVIPITLVTSWRLQKLMPPRAPLTMGEANKLILAASSLNMVLPSKAGDFVKAYFMTDRLKIKGSLALSLVVFEKTCDLLSLLLWCAFGLLFYPGKDSLFWIFTLVIFGGLFTGLLMIGSKKFSFQIFKITEIIVPRKFSGKVNQFKISWDEMYTFFWSDYKHLAKVAMISIFIWFLHLLQIWFFILALNAWAPFPVSLALSPLAILIGLLPLTFAGIGTRDAALIAFYHPYFDAAVGAALGILCTTRYLIPAICGLPFLSQYMASIKLMRKKQSEMPEDEISQLR